MKKILLITGAATVLLGACKKSENTPDETSITASATQAATGQAITFTVATAKNAVNWTVSPAATASKQYSITTQKTNVITFNQPGTYTVSVRARNIYYDSVVHHNNIDSCWHHGGGDAGGCSRGRDSASVTIKITS